MTFPWKKEVIKHIKKKKKENGLRTIYKRRLNALKDKKYFLFLKMDVKWYINEDCIENELILFIKVEMSAGVRITRRLDTKRHIYRVGHRLLDSEALWLEIAWCLCVFKTILTISKENKKSRILVEDVKNISIGFVEKLWPYPVLFRKK